MSGHANGTPLTAGWFVWRSPSNAVGGLAAHWSGTYVLGRSKIPPFRRFMTDLHATLRMTLCAGLFAGAIANAQAPATAAPATVPSAEEQITQAVLPLP